MLSQLCGLQRKAPDQDDMRPPEYSGRGFRTNRLHRCQGCCCLHCRRVVRSTSRCTECNFHPTWRSMRACHSPFQRDSGGSESPLTVALPVAWFGAAFRPTCSEQAALNVGSIHASLKALFWRSSVSRLSFHRLSGSFPQPVPFRAWQFIPPRTAAGRVASQPQPAETRMTSGCCDHSAYQARNSAYWISA